MNADQLLTHYEQIADAPDAIPRLRRFILDLAVRGKLVEQDPADEPASELLKRIATEKARLVKAGEIKVRKVTPRERDEPIEFELPTGWELTDLGELAFKITDGAHKTPTYVESGVPFVSVKDFSGGQLSLENTRFIPESEHALLFQRCDPKRGDILLGRIGTLGKAVLVDTDVEFSLFVSVGLIRFDHNNIDPIFFRLLLNSPFVEGEFNRIKVGGGTHTNKLNLGDLHTVALPLPPLAEQHRIVAKVDELMALCDRLEAARAEREATRDRLAAASLARLNAPDPDPAVFQNHAAFALDNLAPLTTRPDQIKALRQTILNLAVRGKLVEQDPTDEPASELVGQAHKRMDELVGGGSAAKMKTIAAIDKSDYLFDLPIGWCWVRFGHLAQLITKGSSPKWQGIEYVTKDKGVLFITSENVGIYRLTKLDTPKFVESRFNEIEPRSILRKGDILLNLVGASIGRSAEFGLDDVANINQAVALIRPISLEEYFLNQYVLHYLNSPTGVDEMLGSRVINAQPNISLTDTRNFLIPLPPIAEQHRIVAKVDELMGLCDRLEASLATADTTRARLLEALLHEALTPGEDQEAA